LLGASFVSSAHEQRREVIGLYHRHAACVRGVKCFPIDLADVKETTRLIENLSPSAVIHCAAATDVDWCEEHPREVETINVTASAVIAQVTARSGAKLIYISTDSVFDGRRGNYVETDIPDPVNVYAKSKLRAEKEVLCHHPGALIARVSIYGWSPRDKESLAEWILNQLSEGNTVSGFADVIFCPLLANDLAEVLLAMLDQKLIGLYHVVGSEPISKYEFAKRVASKFGFDPAQVVATCVTDSELKAQRPRNISLSTAKISAALGRPMPGVDAGLNKFARLRESGYLESIKTPLAEVRK
jgi:dTDP-4-dehydrorhamnose reductase